MLGSQVLGALIDKYPNEFELYVLWTCQERGPKKCTFQGEFGINTLEIVHYSGSSVLELRFNGDLLACAGVPPLQGGPGVWLTPMAAPDLMALLGDRGWRFVRYSADNPIYRPPDTACRACPYFLSCELATAL